MSSSDFQHKELIESLDELTSTQFGRRLFLQVAPLLVVYSCSSGKKTRFREGDNKGQKISLTPSDELKMTQEVLPKMRADYPIFNNPELQNYINTLGQSIITKNDLHNKPYAYNFSVVDVNYVNAFALPAGTIMITAPLIAMAESEAELAGVISHEIGHVKARHAAERMEQAKKDKNKSLLYMGLGGLIGGAAGAGLGKLLCKPKDDECVKRTALLGAAAGVGGGLLIQKYAFMANSQEDELEADRVGYRLAVGAGYDKERVGDFYTKLLEMEKKSKTANDPLISQLSDAMSTHPPSVERVKQLRQMAANDAAKKGGIISSKGFDRMRKVASVVTKKST